MADGAPEGTQETGSGLRAQLEAALAQIASLTSENVSYKAKELIGAKGYKRVTHEQLKDVKAEDLEARAEELEQAGAAAEEAALRRVLTAQGLDEKEIDSSIAALTGSDPKADSTQALSRIRAATQLPATPPPAANAVDTENLHGEALLRHAMTVGAKAS